MSFYFPTAKHPPPSNVHFPGSPIVSRAVMFQIDLYTVEKHPPSCIKYCMLHLPAAFCNFLSKSISPAGFHVSSFAYQPLQHCGNLHMNWMCTEIYGRSKVIPGVTRHTGIVVHVKRIGTGLYVKGKIWSHR